MQKSELSRKRESLSEVLGNSKTVMTNGAHPPNGVRIRSGLSLFFAKMSEARCDRESLRIIMIAKFRSARRPFTVTQKFGFAFDRRSEREIQSPTMPETSPLISELDASDRCRKIAPKDVYSRYHLISPAFTKKCAPQLPVCQTDGRIVGRRSQSTVSLHSPAPAIDS